MRATDATGDRRRKLETSHDDLGQIDVIDDLRQHLRKWRTRLLWQRIIYFLALATVAFALFRLMGWFDHPNATGLFGATLGGLLALILMSLWLSKHWAALTAENFVLHLNRRFPDFEESAQLLLLNHSELQPLQQLQKRRCLAAYAGNIKKAEIWHPPIRYRNALILTLAFALLAVLAPQMRVIASQFIFAQEQRKQELQSQNPGETGIRQIAVRVTPPVYTGMDTTESQTLDLEVFEGSLVAWSLLIQDKADSYAIEFSDGQQLPLRLEAGRWQASHQANSTDLYKIVASKAEVSHYLGNIYTLTVQLDQAPDIKILEPTVTTLEIPKSGPAQFDTQVLVKDDFGIGAVEIVASVAKGSGEGVKFRDQTLSFDSSISTEAGQLYQRIWDLASLGMEPGDEIYFSVVATDNKQPQANTSRSTTLIIRWLEDEEPGIAADGLAIDFIPEFFKSQRQIIIDTEQLIEDQPDLDEQTFKNTSYEIGQAQADLKQKYGQFLGDEFGEGPGEQLGHAGSSSTTSGADNHAEDDPDHNQSGVDHPEGNHEEVASRPDGAHGHVESGVTINNATNIGDIVKLFGHDHGDPEIGKVVKQSPIAHMKRAVSEMWLAERHLMQAEPELALPYEYEAYKYLKLARQADRIYVKRLGFEPPPVSEENRLTGDLKEIRNYSLQQQADASDLPTARARQRLLRQVWQLLNANGSEDEIKADEDIILATMSDEYKTLSQQRPALIKQAASIEKLRAGKQWQIRNCDDCLAELKQSIWNLMDDGDALLHPARAAYGSEDELIQSYQYQLQSRSGTLTSDSRPQPTQDEKQP